MSVERLTLEWLPGRYAVCRLEPDELLPEWCEPGRRSLTAMGLLSITRTDRELSIVIDEQCVPKTAKVQRGFAAMRIVGTLDFSLVGILAELISALARANVAVFVLSTYDTDILMIRSDDASLAEQALRCVADVIAR